MFNLIYFFSNYFIKVNIIIFKVALIFMPLSKAIKPFRQLKYKFQFSSPAQDIIDFNYIKKYINKDAAYTLIPSMENSIIFNPLDKVIQILPYTQKAIIDISLPYFCLGKKTMIRHFARYIICNKRLLGIRIKHSQHWPKSKNQKISIPQALRKFYLQNNIKDFQTQILVGDFLISTKNFKIAPLFLSQLMLMTDNIITNLFSQYYNLGCQIFSVLNDLPEQKKKNLGKPMNVLKRWKKQSIAILYYGMYGVNGMDEFFKTEAFGSQDSTSYKKIEVENPNQVYTETIIFDIVKLQNRRKMVLQENLTSNLTSQIQILYINHSIKICHQKILTTYEAQQQIQVQPESQIQRKKRMSRLYLWNLFCNINRRNPFTLSFPLLNKDEQLFKQIQQLCQFAILPLGQLINFLKLDPKIKIPKAYESQGIKFIPIEKVSRQTNNLYLYFDIKERLGNSIYEKSSNNFLQQVQAKSINCIPWLTQAFMKTIAVNDQNQASKQNPELSENQNFIQSFLKKKFGQTLHDFYFDLARYKRRNQLTQEFIREMFELMKRKIKNKLEVSQFQIFILNTSFEEAKSIFKQAQISFFSSSSVYGKDLKTQQQIQDNQQEQKKQAGGYKGFINKIKHHVINQKKMNYQCHLCKALFNKKQKFDFGRKCFKCNNFLCFACIDSKNISVNPSIQSCQICLVCQKKCDCMVCDKRKQIPRHAQSRRIIEDDYQQKKFKKQLLSKNFTDQKTTTIKKMTNFKQQDFSQKKTIQNELSKHIQNEEQFIPIKGCIQCAFNNNNTRNIYFQCPVCKSDKCFECERSQNPKRTWVLRGQIKCNKCFEKFNEENKLRNQIKSLKDKLILFQQQINVLKRQKVMGSFYNNYQSTTYNQAIIQQQPCHSPQSESSKGKATPIFDRSQIQRNSNVSSPVERNEFNMPSQRQSLNSFAKNQKKVRKNSSQPTQGGKEPQMNKKKLNSSKNSSRSKSQDKQSVASFNQNKKSNLKTNLDRRSNSSKSSVGVPKRSESVQSGQFEGSSSSIKSNKQIKKPDWSSNNNNNQGKFNNHHQSSTRQNDSYNIGKGKFNNNNNNSNNNFFNNNNNNNRGNNDNYKVDNNNNNKRDNNNNNNYNGGYNNSNNNQNRNNNKGRFQNNSNNGNNNGSFNSGNGGNISKKWENRNENQNKNKNQLFSGNSNRNNSYKSSNQNQSRSRDMDQRSNHSKDSDRKGQIISQGNKRNNNLGQDIDY